MHNIDRTLQELEAGPGYQDEFETGYDGQHEFEHEFEDEFEQAFEQSFSAGYQNETFEMGGPDQELELAYQLLEVGSEQELNQFLGDLMTKAADAGRRFVASDNGQKVGRYLMNFGQKTLPGLAGKYGGQAGAALGGRAGAALGGRLGPLGARAGAALGQDTGQWAGGKAGRWLGSKAGNVLASNAKRIFNLELEMLAPAEQELEIARSFVRFANDVTRRASQITRQNPNIGPADLGRQVLAAVVPRHAPGLLPGGIPRARAARGSWSRRGNTLVLHGV
ncbi:hypothetical protein [Hymenobacter rubripertinctus]|uniref:Uncharacterized protein n=1 Tax=Hymenobacter rubripertinctus TaxID=2029981 RepID=A0A418R0T1_9BACT|nr:hypothetical protein [Hymenobacter rubripertinctus]RIY11014.1 hypothetical protein D0T11_08365 [Hymenobacter rubripertinctus]